MLWWKAGARRRAYACATSMRPIVVIALDIHVISKVGCVRSGEEDTENSERNSFVMNLEVPDWCIS